ncbi:MAG: hypothetical protein DHS20C11_06240 [Lysobacteraceae bacterium]|nr:MAG: hypothetical protein DHS20C11_06240 [Xanthomonadaceae bacterium]
MQSSLAQILKWRGLTFMVVTGALLNAYATFAFAGPAWPEVALSAVVGAAPLLVLFSWGDRNFELSWLRKLWKPSVVMLGLLGLVLYFLNGLNAEEVSGSEQMSVFMLPVFLLLAYLTCILLAEVLSGASGLSKKVKGKNA